MFLTFHACATEGALPDRTRTPSPTPGTSRNIRRLSESLSVWAASLPSPAHQLSLEKARSNQTPGAREDRILRRRYSKLRLRKVQSPARVPASGRSDLNAPPAGPPRQARGQSPRPLNMTALPSRSRRVQTLAILLCSLATVFYALPSVFSNFLSLS